MTDTRETVEMPKPTAWPMTLALAITLAAAGLVTNFAFSAVGLVLTAVAIAGWIGQLLPGQGTEEVPWPRLKSVPGRSRKGPVAYCRQANPSTVLNSPSQRTPIPRAFAVESPEES